MKYIGAFLVACVCNLCMAYADNADIPVKDDFGGQTVTDLQGFSLTSLQDFTLEVEAVAGTTIKVCNGVISYTPTGSGKVRFVHYGSLVYIYENGTYLMSQSLNVAAVDYPNLYDTTTYPQGIYSDKNLLQNPGFETVAGNASGYSDGSRTIDGVYWKAYNASRVALWGTGNLTTIRNNGITGKSLLMHQDGYFLTQQLNAGKILPGVPYRLTYRQKANNSTQAGATYQILLGLSEFAADLYSSDTYTCTNTTAETHIFNFVAPATAAASSPAYLCFAKTYSGDQKLEYLDDISLVRGEWGKGIEGASSALYLDGTAYAPQDNGEMRQVTFSNAGDITYSHLTNMQATLSGNSCLHLTDSVALVNSTINLLSSGSWLYIEALHPSQVIAQYIKTKKITINGDSVVLKLATDGDNVSQNARIGLYVSGAVLIPYGNATDAHALQVFTQENFEGDSTTFAVGVPVTSLGTFNNKIRSMKLKKGYMATLANQIDGTGFSKVFIADEADLELAVMPKGLQGTASFLRVLRWDWPGQKGHAGGWDTEMGNIVWYDWSSGGDVTNPDLSYTPHRTKRSYPSLESINAKQNVNHVLYYNEPDHPEQHKDDNGGLAIDVATAVNSYPALMASGLRVGSPAPTNFSWLYNFVKECDKRNYRLDFVAVHAYWYTSMSSWRSQLKAVYSNTRRPVWVTEWNNGANWTSNNFPDATGASCDAECNVIYDSNGNTTTVTLPNTAANAAKQLSDIKSIVTIMEDKELNIERYFIYEWVNECRQLAYNGKLTPAGKWWAQNPSRKAYINPYDHQWKLVLPDFAIAQNTSAVLSYNFSWKDYNRETAAGYLVQRNDGDGKWYDTSDTIIGDRSDRGAQREDAMPVVTVTLPVQVSGNTLFRVKAVGYEGSLAYSASDTIYADSLITEAPVLAVSSQRKNTITITWNLVANAKCYQVYRAAYSDSIYSLVKDGNTKLSNYDNALESNTAYWYKVCAVNNRCVGPSSAPILAITKKSDGSDGDNPLNTAVIPLKESSAGGVNNDLYSVSGVKMDRPVKGIVVQKGKKIMVK